MSERGTEDSSLYIYEAASARQTGEIIPRASYPTAGGSLAWLPDGKSFFYTRYPHPQERPEADLHFYQQVWVHRLGTPPDSDSYVLGKEFYRIAIIVLDSDAKGKYFIATVANGGGFEFEHFLRTPNGQWNQITRLEDHVVSASFGDDEALYLISRKDAPRGKLLRLPIGSRSLAEATLIVPEGTTTMERPIPESADKLPLVTASKIYVKMTDGGPNQISIYDRFGKPLGNVPLNGPAAVDNLIALQGDCVAFQTEGYLDPPTMCIFDGGEVRATAVRVSPQADLSGLEVERVFAESADGTSVPMSIIHRKDLMRDGAAPALIWGYGGFGISITPSYLATSDFMLWLEHGGTLVLTNLRGGSEYGETWHRAGSLAHKQNVFDDFAACARYVIDQKYSSPAHIVARGGSNGGLLMGAALTQYPSYFRAVVSRVGIYDMLRAEIDPNGAFCVTEYGSVKDPVQFQALYAYAAGRIRPRRGCRGSDQARGDPLTFRGCRTGDTPMTPPSQLTYTGVLLAVFANQICLPVPAVFFLIAAGALAAHGNMSTSTVVLLSVLSCLAADGIWFLLGRQWGPQAMRLLCRFTADPRGCSRDAQEKFRRYGLSLLCVAKFVPGLDGLMPPLAGAEGVSLAGFFALDAVGSFLWSGFYVGVGYLFSGELEIAVGWVKHFGTALALAIGVPLCIYIGWRGLALIRMICQLRVRLISAPMLHRKLSSGSKVALLDLLYFEEEADIESRPAIPGAFRIDPTRLRNAPRIAVPDDVEIVLYGSSRSHIMTAHAALALKRIGVENVWVLEGGLHGWRERGLPLSPFPDAPEVVAERLGVTLPDALPALAAGSFIP